MRELIHIDDVQGVTLSAAVARVAEAVNPIPVLARTVTALSACWIELEQIDLQRETLRRQHEVLSTTMRQREQYIAGVFLALNLQMKVENDALESLQDAFRECRVQSTQRGVPEDERMLHAKNAVIYAELMTATLTQRRRDLIGMIDLYDLPSIARLVAQVRAIAS